jgi:hypothetical protein
MESILRLHSEFRIFQPTTPEKGRLGGNSKLKTQNSELQCCFHHPGPPIVECRRGVSMITRIEHGDILELRLDRPPVNALSPEMLQGLAGAVREAPAAGARALVISGREGMFSAGLDIPHLVSLDRDELEHAVDGFFGALETVAASVVPIAVAITGHSPAGGAVVAMCCDYRVMAEGRLRHRPQRGPDREDPVSDPQAAVHLRQPREHPRGRPLRSQEPAQRRLPDRDQRDQDRRPGPAPRRGPLRARRRRHRGALRGQPGAPDRAPARQAADGGVPGRRPASRSASTASRSASRPRPSASSPSRSRTRSGSTRRSGSPSPTTRRTTTPTGSSGPARSSCGRSAGAGPSTSSSTPSTRGTRGNIENFVGVAQVPIGLAGPIKDQRRARAGRVRGSPGDHRGHPGGLVQPRHEGAQPLRRRHLHGVGRPHAAGAGVRLRLGAGGATSATGCTPTWRRSAQAAEATSSVAKLLDIDAFLANKFAYLRFNYATGDAAGQNMVGRATFAACSWMLDHLDNVRSFYLESNLATDKKHSQINIMRTRGKRVTAEAVVPSATCWCSTCGSSRRASTTTRRSPTSGRSSPAPTTTAPTRPTASPPCSSPPARTWPTWPSRLGHPLHRAHARRDLYISLTIPSLIVATYGGGTGPADPARVPRDADGLRGPKGKVRKLAEIVGGSPWPERSRWAPRSPRSTGCRRTRSTAATGDAAGDPLMPEKPPTPRAGEVPRPRRAARRPRGAGPTSTSRAGEARPHHHAPGPGASLGGYVASLEAARQRGGGGLLFRLRAFVASSCSAGSSIREIVGHALPGPAPGAPRDARPDLRQARPDPQPAAGPPAASGHHRADEPARATCRRSPSRRSAR